MSKVSIVVTPREQFSCAPGRIQTLLERTPADAEIVYVANGASAARAAGLKAILSGRVATFVHGPELLPQNVARNLGARHARPDADFYVFLDNDVIVEPGWLDAMVGCARETGAGAVGPLMQEGDPAKHIVHMIGGIYREIETANGRVAFERHFRGHRPLADLESPPVRSAVDYVEGHCLLASRRAFDACAGFDERLITMYEYIDLCLRMQEAGFEAYVEPSAVATYDPDVDLKIEDLPAFLKRWDLSDSRATFDHFTAKRGLRHDCELVVFAESFVREHRGRLRLFDGGAERARPLGPEGFPAPLGLADLEDALSMGGFSVSGCTAAAWLTKALRPFAANPAASHQAVYLHGLRAAQYLVRDGADIALIAAAFVYPMMRAGHIDRSQSEIFVKAAAKHWEFARLGPLLKSIFELETRLIELFGGDPAAAPAETLRQSAVLAALVGAQNPGNAPAAFVTMLDILDGIGFRAVAGSCRIAITAVRSAAE